MRFSALTALACLGFAVTSTAAPTTEAVIASPQGDELPAFVTPSNATESDIAAARKIVAKAIAEMARLNKARVENPARNHGRFRLKESDSALARRNGTEQTGHPVLVPTDEMSRAAALLAELHAEPLPTNVTRRATPWYMPGLKHLGGVPWGGDSSYKTYRNVLDYGADNNGARDSTAAIQKAIDDGKRCGANCNGSTLKNAIVYFPPGKYLVSKSISVLFGTQIIGDANDPPTIVAAASYIGLGVLSTDVYAENGGVGPDGNALEWYINTARFYGQIRNINVDITATNPTAYVAAFHYQMAQATTMENVVITAKTGTTQQGIYAENGSGGVISDITFNGGNFGFYGGAQQFSASRLTFNGCSTGIQLIWDWGWSWKSITMNGVGVGMRLHNEADGSLPGSVSIVDSTFTNMGQAAIEMAAPADGTDKGFTGVTLDNVQLGGGIIDKAGGASIVAGGYYKTYVIGVGYKGKTRTWLRQTKDYTREPSLLGPSRSGLQVAPYLERKRPQYQDKSAADFVHLKDLGAKGDGSTDDTAAIQAALNRYGDGSKIIYVDAGTYIIKDTITVPRRAKIVGETWSQLAANGDKFGDMMKPRAMLQIGNEGDVGDVELQDLILTSKGPTPGLVCMKWNVAGSSPGAAGLWDVHVRLGGAVGTELTPKECPPIRTGTNPVQCQVASLLLHVTRQASGYFDNMWLWVGDHQIDDPLLADPLNNMDQISVYSARGALLESQKPVWLYGTASEHSVMYQFNFDNAMNVVTTLLQTESPYYQPTPKPPAPFTSALGVYKSDPFYECTQGDADGCDESWAVVIRRSQNIHITTAGTYSWFSTYTQDCISPQLCQKSLWLLGVVNGDNIRIEQVVAIGAKNIFATRDGGPIISAAANTAVSKHPKWAHVSLMEVPSQGHLEPERIDVCAKTPRTYSAADMPVGDLAVWSADGSGFSVVDSSYLNYVTIVNLTPYRFVRAGGPTPHQVTADFQDVPSGRAMQAHVSYDFHTGISWVDSNGYYRYQLEGTNKYFWVRITTHIPDDHARRVVFDLGEMGMGSRELGFPSDTANVALVITGSEDFGYINSLQLNGGAWQKGIASVIEDRALRHVVVPGSHDAGMSRISLESGYNGFGASYNTATQSLRHHDQLTAGSRYFDMRIVSTGGLDFWAAHVNDHKADVMVGATGEPLQDMIDDVNRFTANNPGEVIMWHIKYMVDFPIGLDIKKSRPWNTEMQDRFFDRLQLINNRCPNLPLSLGDKTSQTIDTLNMGFLMAQNGGRGCVLLIVDEDRSTWARPELTSQGIYGAGWIRRHDAWPEKRLAIEVADFHAAGVSLKPRDNTTSRAADGTNKDDYYIMQWHTTPTLFDTDVTISINSKANQEMNPALYNYGMAPITPDHFPTVIQVDAMGLFHLNDLSEASYNPAFQTLAIGLNLYMVSQNCKVTSKPNPLAPRLGTTSSNFGIASITSAVENFDQGNDGIANGTGAAAPGVVATGFGVKEVFTGVIFINGTVLEERPKDFCVTCTYGSNGTVINHAPKDWVM